MRALGILHVTGASAARRTSKAVKRNGRRRTSWNSPLLSARPSVTANGLTVARPSVTGNSPGACRSAELLREGGGTTRDLRLKDV